MPLSKSIFQIIRSKLYHKFSKLATFNHSISFTSSITEYLIFKKIKHQSYSPKWKILSRNKISFSSKYFTYIANSITSMSNFMRALKSPIAWNFRSRIHTQIYTRTDRCACKFEEDCPAWWIWKLTTDSRNEKYDRLYRVLRTRRRSWWQTDRTEARWIIRETFNLESWST